MNKPIKHIAIVCNYEVRPVRVGGMDRFFVAYDAFAKANNFQLTWYFSKFEPYSFYEKLSVIDADGKNVESFFLEQLAVTEERYDILITHFTSLCSSFYKQARKIQDFDKVIVVDHNPRPLNGFALKKQIKNRIKGFLYHKYIDQFIGVSNYTSGHIVNDLGGAVIRKTKTIYNGIDVAPVKVSDRDRARIYSAQGKLRLIVVSHLRESKGIQDALSALALLDITSLEKLEVHIYGTGPMETELRQMSLNLNLQQHVVFHGSSSNIPEILSAFDYLLQPTHMECFSLSILESLAANVPVITTTVGGNPEIIKDGLNGFLYEAKDINHLRHIIKKVASGQKKIHQETRSAIAKNFDLHRMVSDHFKIISCH